MVGAERTDADRPPPTNVSDPCGRCLSSNFAVTEPPPDGGGVKNGVFDEGEKKRTRSRDEMQSAKS